MKPGCGYITNPFLMFLPVYASSVVSEILSGHMSFLLNLILVNQIYAHEKT